MLENLNSHDYVTEWSAPPTRPLKPLRDASTLALPDSALSNLDKKATQAVTAHSTVFKGKEASADNFRVIKNSNVVIASFLSAQKPSATSA